MDDEHIIELWDRCGGNTEQLLPAKCEYRDALAFLLAEGFARVRHRIRQKARERIKTEELSEAGIRSISSSARYDYPRAKQAIRSRTLTMLTSWMIGDVALADMKKEGLVVEAARERSSGNGHFVNARFYESLAEPMNERETVGDHWKDEGARILHQSILDEIVRQSPPPELPARRPRASTPEQVSI